MYRPLRRPVSYLTLQLNHLGPFTLDWTQQIIIALISALDASKFNENFNIDPVYSSKMKNSTYDPTQMSFRIDASSALSDWLESYFTCFDWSKTRSREHQFENFPQYQNCLIPTGHKIAIIIPFRDDGSKARLNQFKILLHYMIPMLIRQNIKFQFFVITQESFKASSTFQKCHQYHGVTNIETISDSKFYFQ